MATVKFILQSKKNPAGIYVRLRDYNLDAKAKTVYSINPKEWSSKKGKPGTPITIIGEDLEQEKVRKNALEKLDADLKKFGARLLAAYNNEEDKSVVSSQWLKDQINPPEKKTEAPKKLIEYFDYYAKHRKAELSPSTYSKLNVNKQMFIRFQEDQGRTFLVRDVNFDFVHDFQAYCKKQKYAHNTVSRAIKFLKTICKHAKANNIQVSHQLDSISVKIEKVDKVYLNPEEIALIEKAELIDDYLDNARDWLLISCEMGQRVSDFMRFNKGMTAYDPKDKRTYIGFTQIKTGKILSLPLSKKVMKILKKRNGEFPRPISDQRYNDYIKLVGEKAGLTDKVEGSKKDPKTERKISGMFPKFELISSHIGRRSFCTNNYGKVPTGLLIKFSGHATEFQLRDYIGKSDDNDAKELSKYF